MSSRRALALLVADPGTSADLITSAKAVLDSAAAISEYRTFSESVEHTVAMLAEVVTMSDFVVILQSRPEPSDKVLTAVIAARQHDKPVYALTAPGVKLGIDVLESRSLDSPDLRDWIEWIQRRHG